MILLPVIERELRVAARNRRTYRQRFLAALAVIGASVWIFFDLRTRGYTPDALGAEIFQAVTFIALLISLLAGLLETADAISQERREGTLGLLFLTDLQSAHVLAGKLFALSIPSFFSLATMAPILGIPFLLGGVSSGEMIRTCLVLLAALALSLSAGILCSCLAKDDRVTRVLTFLLLAVPSMLPRVSPFWTLSNVLDKDILSIGVTDFYGALALQFAISFGFFALATLCARSAWRERPPSMAWQRWLDRWSISSSGTPEQRKRWRTEMLDNNPAIWLACRHREGTALIWAFVGIGIVVAAWSWVKYRQLDPILMAIILVTLHFVLKASFALAAARSLADEARTGSLELLLTTPITPQRLIEGHLYGLFRSFGGPAAIVMAFNVVWIFFGRIESFFLHDFPDYVWTGVAFVIFDMMAIALYATWLGFKTGRAGKAAIRTLLLVIALPDLGVLFAPAITQSIRFWWAPAIWLAVDVILIARALPKFKTLREQTAARYSANSAPE